MRYEIIHGDNMTALANMADNSVDSVCTDPPYGLGKEPDPVKMLQAWLDYGYLEVGGRGFMGKQWDAFVPQPIFWKEVYRVLKPGGHVLSFAGTRTYDWMVMAIRLAGFEIRDQLVWMYGGGFPKSYDVSKGIDKMDAGHERQERNKKFTAWMRSTGVSSSELDELTNSFMGSHYLTDKSQAAVPTAAMFAPIRQWLEYEKIAIPDYIEALIHDRTVESENMKSREVVEERTMIQGGGSSLQIRMGDAREVNADITAPHTPGAQQWDGWGTALSPSHEPIVLARKPLEKGLTIAQNVLKWGTGALNIDGCRIGKSIQDRHDYGIDGDENKPSENAVCYGDRERVAYVPDSGGRWPSNLLLANVPSVIGLFPETGKATTGVRDPNGTMGYHGGASGLPDVVSGHSDNGGSASRYFFRADLLPVEIEEQLAQDDEQQLSIEQKAIYCSKPSKYERNLGKLTEVGHPTVKPVSLMHHLVTLITPPNGVCVDPFLGSGTTGIGAMLAGPNIRFKGLEMTAEYIPIATDRIKNWKRYRQFIEAKATDTPAKKASTSAKAVQGSLF